jgi:hypothetical protein
MPAAQDETRTARPKEGTVADKPAALILAALGRAAAAPDGLPLFAAKAAGLFPATAPGKQAAQRCRDEGWLDVRTPAAEPPPDVGANGAAVLTRKKTKTPPETACLTEKGLAWLLDQGSPRAVLEDFVRVLEARQAQAADLLAAVRRLQAGFDALKANAEKVLARAAAPAAGPGESLLDRFLRFRGEAAAAPAPDADLGAAVLARLGQWGGGASEDCPLPELYRQVRAAAPAATVGAFHDALRRLHEAGRVYLHPWTGPLYELPEPPYALLVGHEVAYYASLRQG